MNDRGFKLYGLSLANVHTARGKSIACVFVFHLSLFFSGTDFFTIFGKFVFYPLPSLSSLVCRYVYTKFFIYVANLRAYTRARNDREFAFGSQKFALVRRARANERYAEFPNSSFARELRNGNFLRVKFYFDIRGTHEISFRASESTYARIDDPHTWRIVRPTFYVEGSILYLESSFKERAILPAELKLTRIYFQASPINR